MCTNERGHDDVDILFAIVTNRKVIENRKFRFSFSFRCIFLAVANDSLHQLTQSIELAQPKKRKSHETFFDVFVCHWRKKKVIELQRQTSKSIFLVCAPLERQQNVVVILHIRCRCECVLSICFKFVVCITRSLPFSDVEYIRLASKTTQSTMSENVKFEMNHEGIFID